MVGYIILSAICVIYDVCYIVHNIKKSNAAAAIGAFFTAAFVVLICSLLLLSAK